MFNLNQNPLYYLLFDAFHVRKKTMLLFIFQCFVFFRKDLLQIWHSGENDTLVAKATNVGQTALKVSKLRVIIVL